MIQFIAKLCVPTGETVRALLEAGSPNELSIVDYDGAVDLLPSRPEQASAVMIEGLFRQVGRNLGAVPVFSCARAAHLTH